MYLDKIIPFLEKAPLLRQHIEMLAMEKVFSPIGVEDLEFYKEVIPIYSQDRPRIVLVQPLGLYVFCGSLLKLALYKTNREMECTIAEVDYSAVADDIDVDMETKGTKLATYLESNGYSAEPIFTDKYINKAANRVAMTAGDIEDITAVYKSHLDVINEATSTPEEQEYRSSHRLNFFVFDAKKGAEYAITQYVKAPDNSRYDRVPILIGPTAVLKSALVKKVAKANGFRVVDLRTAFMTRLDFEGLTTKTEIDNKVYTIKNMMADMMVCTDNFIDYAREVTKDIEVEISSGKHAGADLLNLKKALFRYQEYSKPPILFLDEILRANPTVLTAMMQTLREKVFLTFKMSYCRIITAGNLPIDIVEANPELRDTYIATELTDKAFPERFFPLLVFPGDIKVMWNRWAVEYDKKIDPETGEETNEYKDNQHIHPDIVEYLKKYPQNEYNFDYVIDDYNARGKRGRDQLATTPFPNCRTWEIFSNYLYRMESTHLIMESIVKGTVGKHIYPTLSPFLVSKKWTIQATDDASEMDDFLTHSLNACIPTLLIGPSSIGKTSRIKNYVEEIMPDGKPRAELIPVNMTQADRSDIMGSPALQKIATFSVGDTLNSPVFHSLRDSIASKLEKYDLPENITVKGPVKSVVRKIIDALEGGREVVIFYDEVNRVNDPCLMSAIFESVSDHRIFGYDFSDFKDRVRIVSACNMGEAYEDAMELDPAFAARFNILRRDGYRVADVEALLKYMKVHNYNEDLQVWIASKTKDEMLAFISQVDERRVEYGCPSLCGFHDMGLALDTAHMVPGMTGVFLFMDPAFTAAIMSLGDPSDAKYISTVRGLGDATVRNVSRWAALGMDIGTGETGGGFLSPDKLVEEFKLWYGDLKDATDLKEQQKFAEFLFDTITAMVGLEKLVARARIANLSPHVGDKVAENFTSYYNLVSGTKDSVITLEDLKDIDLIDPYVGQQLVGAGDNDFVQKYLPVLDEFITFYGDSNPLTPDHYKAFLEAGLSRIMSPNQKIYLLKSVTMGASDMLGIMIGEDKDYVVKVLTDHDLYVPALVESKLDMIYPPNLPTTTSSGNSVSQGTRNALQRKPVFLK